VRTIGARTKQEQINACESPSYLAQRTYINGSPGAASESLVSRKKHPGCAIETLWQKYNLTNINVTVGETNQEHVML